MKAVSTSISRPGSIVAAILATVITTFPIFSCFADSHHKTGNNFSGNVSIENFGKVNDHFYRGSQPSKEGYSQLAALGVKTIIDLRDDAKGSSQAMAEAAGLHYINLPMSDKKYPQADAAEKFLAIANNSENWPIYVHCAGGRHRTGIMTAVYRITVDGWDMDKAYNEMKQYDFYTSWGHSAMKDYIFDFYRQAKEKQVANKRAENVMTSVEPTTTNK